MADGGLGPAGQGGGGGDSKVESQATSYGVMGGHGVIRFLANYSRVPLTNPICLDYADGSSEPRDLKRTLLPLLPAALSFFSFTHPPLSPFAHR